MESTKGKDVDGDSYEPNDVQKKKEGWSSKLNRTTNVIWNSSKKEFIGRTWDSWAKIGLFYLVFYSSLAAFFAIMLVGFFRTLDANAPTQQNMYSLIKANPGMGFRPMPSISTTLIRFNQGVPDNYRPFTKDLDKYLAEYYNQTGANVVNCTESTDGVQMAADGNVCRVGNSMFGDECTSQKDYSFDEGRPCILLKINKVYNWHPAPFTNESLNDPNDKLAQEAKQKLGSRLDENYVGISCEGENDADQDNLGKVTYYPEKGFPRSFFPYKKQANYRPPIVFVKFETPKPGVLIQVWCRIWTHNIRHHKNDKAGSIHFELLID